MEFSLKLIKASKLLLCVFLSLAVAGCGSEGEEGKTQLVESTIIAPSELCPFGGLRVNTGIDSNNNGLLEENEIQSSTHRCNSTTPIAESGTFYIYNSSVFQTQLSANDPDSQNLIYTLQVDAEFGDAFIGESGLLSYSVNENYVGEDKLTYSVTDGETKSTAEITIIAVDTFLQLSSPSPEYSVEVGIKQQQQTTIINTGDEDILIGAGSSPQWYSIISNNISVPANSQVDITFDVDTTLLTVGSYQEEVTFTTAEPGAPTLTQNMTLYVTANVRAPAMVTDLALDGDLEYNQAKLKWTAVADSGTRGLPVTAFDIRYSNSPITEETWETATLLVLSQKPGEAESIESVTATGLVANTTYYFAIKSIDNNNLLSFLSNILSFTTPPPPPPVSEANQNLEVSLKEAEQTTTNVTINNFGQSPLIYSTQLTINPQPSATGFTALKSIAKPARLKVSSLGEHSGNIIIKYHDDNVSGQSLNNVMTQHNLQKIKSIDFLNLKIVRPQQSGAEAYVLLINELNNMPEVAYAEPDYKVQALYLPDDALFDQQWALNNNGQTGGTVDADINGTESWDLYKDGSNVIVAVIDTGVKYDHQDLADNAWINTNEIAGNGIDDDNNGFIDDIYGYDFTNSDGDPMDDNGHGTHCAGILGAKGDNGMGISGVAHSAQIMGLKFLGADGSGSISAAINSIMYAVDNGATILSNSWGGGGFSQALFDAISYANDHDVLFIAAAGNDSSNNDINPSYPANYDLPNVISVASTDHNDQLSSFSNYGMSVHLAAPGSDILSTYNNGGYRHLSGTSMATPYVTGAAVLLRSNSPHLTALETKQILLESVYELDSLNGSIETGGRLDVSKALTDIESINFITIDNGASGEILPGDSATIQITIDATNKLAALYENQIVISTNDPENESITVALDITVLFDEIPPADINDLQINTSGPTSAAMEWTNTGDDGLQDRASALIFAYSTSPITLDNWDTATLINGPVPTDSGSLQEFTIQQLQPATLYYFAMKVIDNSGQYSELSNVISATTNTGAALEVTPNDIPTVTLNKGETSSFTLTVENNGDETLEYSARLTEQAEVEPVQLQRLSVLHAKDQQDFRIGVTPQSSGGPDTFGYSWSDSDEGQVTYDWTDISNSGSSLTFTDDSMSPALDLGFSFNFYDTDYTQIYVSSNGFLTFENTDDGCCSGQPLPSLDNYKSLIAWAWKDLHPKEGSVHYLLNDDEFIMQFTNYGEFNAEGTVTAQIILSSNGTIKFQYHSFGNNFNTTNASVGIENQDSSDGLQVVFNAAYLKDQLAVEISPPATWVALSKSSGSVIAADTDSIGLVFDTTVIEPGVYNTSLVITSNDSAQPEVILPITLEVNAAP
jgi:subtilisin family serine protease